MMLNKDKNTLLKAIQESGIDPDLFTGQDNVIDNEDLFVISLRNSPLLFAVRFKGHFDWFFYRCSQSLPTYPLSDKLLARDTIQLKKAFNAWLKNVVKPHLDNVNTPDLWHILEDTRSHTKFELGMPKDFDSFSDEERIQIRLCLNNFLLLIVDHFNPNKEQLKTIDARLKYLSDALDKHNKFDWKGIAISTLISITVALSLSSEQGHQLFQLFKQVFSNILYLL